MTRAEHNNMQAAYIVPARHLSGRTDEVLSQLDEAVQELLALRHLIVVSAQRSGERVSATPLTSVRPSQRPSALRLLLSRALSVFLV
jgi:hypothetical protein